MCMVCSEYTEATRGHLAGARNRVAIERLCKGPKRYHQPEQGTHTWLTSCRMVKILKKDRSVEGDKKRNG